MKMSHEEYISSNRKKVASVAQGMLNGTINYLEGAIELSSLRSEVDTPENDKDFLVFSGIASDIDQLPIGAQRQSWSNAALERHDLEIQEATRWAKEISLTQCKSLFLRFNV